MAASNGGGAFPQLSNEAQLQIMNLVKQGMPMEEALKRATILADQEAKERSVMIILRFCMSTCSEGNDDGSTDAFAGRCVLSCCIGPVYCL